MFRAKVIASVEGIAQKALPFGTWLAIRPMVIATIERTPDAKLRELVEEIHAASARLREGGR